MNTVNTLISVEVRGLKAKVDQDEWTDCELCLDTCPESFEMEADLAVSRVDEVPFGAEESCRQIVEGCPIEAIITDE